MHFTVTEVAEMLNVSGRKIQMWIKSGGLPANRINNQYRVNRIELLEWAISRNKVLPAGLTNSGTRKAAPASFVDALRQGGIVHFLGGTDKASGSTLSSIDEPADACGPRILGHAHARGTQLQQPWVTCDSDYKQSSCRCNRRRSVFSANLLNSAPPMGSQSTPCSLWRSVARSFCAGLFIIFTRPEAEGQSAPARRIPSRLSGRTANRASIIESKK